MPLSHEEIAFLTREYTALWKDHGVETLSIPPLGRRVPVPAKATAPAPAAPAIHTLGDVQRWLGDCRRCSLCEGRKKIVFGAGNPKAALFFIGEGPAGEEDDQGIPFVGPSGQLLNKIIEAMGYTRDQTYLANIVKCRPPENRVPSQEEMNQCLPFLKAQIALVNPKVIVALGGTAAAALTASTTKAMANLRGKMQTLSWSSQVPVMPTYHPSYLLRNPNAKRLVWEDLKLVKSHLEKMA